jgi:hypothetical protein
MPFFQPKPPPAPEPPPTATAATEVTPVGATHVYVPADVYVAQVAAAAVMLFDAALNAPYPVAFVACALKV